MSYDVDSSVPYGQCIEFTMKLDTSEARTTNPRSWFVIFAEHEVCTAPDCVFAIGRSSTAWPSPATLDHYRPRSATPKRHTQPAGTIAGTVDQR
ncbi:hypothetical protein FRC09_019798 [Ceratobasidium sp. 395]|nr:hypothetical protein FRC09_019798 [Ceratobasidium sp. 395]